MYGDTGSHVRGACFWYLGGPKGGPMDPLSLIRPLGKNVRFNRGEQVYVKGTPADRVYIMCTGELITTATAVDGREVVFYRVDCNYGLAPLTALVGDIPYENDCFAHRDSELVAVVTSEVRMMCKAQP